jgi:hypothetical protein
MRIARTGDLLGHLRCARQLLAEEHVPLPAFWEENIVSSRLLEYEIWNRIYAKQVGARCCDEVRRLIEKVDFVE